MGVMETDAALSPHSPLRRIARVFEQLRADQLDVLAQVYAPQATFQDPFNRVQGLVTDHRDYWDACDFYATVPVLGAVVRRFKRAAAAN